MKIYVRNEIGTIGCEASLIRYGCSLNILTRVTEVIATLNRFITLSRPTLPTKVEALYEQCVCVRYQETNIKSCASR